MRERDDVDAALAALPPAKRSRLNREAARLELLRRAAATELSQYDLDAPLCSAHSHDEEE